MVAVYGMSERIGLVNCAQRQPAFLAGLDGSMQRDCSEETAREIDEEVKTILDEAFARAKEVLSAHRDQLEKIAAELLKKEALDGRSFTGSSAKKCHASKNPCHHCPSQRRRPRANAEINFRNPASPTWSPTPASSCSRHR